MENNDSKMILFYIKNIIINLITVINYNEINLILFFLPYNKCYFNLIFFFL
jgi:hypothetical protein